MQRTARRPPGDARQDCCFGAAHPGPSGMPCCIRRRCCLHAASAGCPQPALSHFGRCQRARQSFARARPYTCLLRVCAILFAVARPRPPQRAQPPLPASLTSSSPSSSGLRRASPLASPVAACPPACSPVRLQQQGMAVRSVYPPGTPMAAALLSSGAVRPAQACQSPAAENGRTQAALRDIGGRGWPWVAVGGPHARPPIARRPQRLRLWDAHTHAHAR